MTLEAVSARVVACRRCPRLVDWRERVAAEKRAAFRDEDYWGRPLPGFGDPRARIVVCGLAPAAHGGNRTGRVFTGDRSGDWLFAALHRAGLARLPTSTSRDDGQRLRDAWVTAAVRCAPPENKPTPEERDACLPFLAEEIAALPRARVVVCLGAFAWDAVSRALRPSSPAGARPPRFGHAVEATLGDLRLVASYHPSQRNTFTGTLTEAMLDGIFARARRLAEEEA